MSAQPSQDAHRPPFFQGFATELVRFVFCYKSVGQAFRSDGQLLLRLLAVAAGRVQALMAEQLRQTNQVVAVVGEVLMRHRMPEQVRMQVDADESRILLAQCPDASFAQWPTLPDEDPAGLHRWA